jgi:hypothetical protein
MYCLPLLSLSIKLVCVCVCVYRIAFVWYSSLWAQSQTHPAKQLQAFVPSSCMLKQKIQHPIFCDITVLGKMKNTLHTIISGAPCK